MTAELPNARNLRAGAGVFAAVAVGAAVLWVASWWRSQGMIHYTLTCTPEQGVYGLHAGSPVRVGGLPRGQVTEVKAEFKDHVLVGYRVDFTLARQIVLYQAAQIHATASGLAGDGAIDIVDTGRGRTLSGARPTRALETSVLEPNGEIASTVPAEYAWIVGSKSASAVGHLTQTLPETWRAFQEIGDDAATRFSLVRTEGADLIGALRSDLKQWQANWTRLSEHAQAAVQKLGAGKDGAPDAVVPMLRAAQQDASQTNYERISARIQMSRDTLSGAVSTLDALMAQGFAAREALGDPDASLGFAKADFSIAGAELSATKREVAAGLWKVIGWPTDQQIVEAKRVEEARIFAQAATEFERSVEALRQALIRDSDLLARAPGLAELLAAQIAAASAQFEAAVTRYGDMLLQPPPSR